MITLTQKEFEQKYGKPAVQSFSRINQAQALRDRLADVGFSTADTITGAIKGEGQFAGQSATRRGITATAAGFSSVPRGALAMAPEPVRSGLEFAGGKIAQGFDSLTGTIADTELFKGAAGQQVMNANGTVDYVPNNLGVLEEGLGVSSGLGEISGNILGAGETALVGNIVQQAVAKSTKVISSAKNLSKSADDTFKTATNLRTKVQEIVGEQSVGPQVQASAERLVQKPAFLEGTAGRTDDVVSQYDKYFDQSAKAINDIKVDPAISVVGSKIGDAFNTVVSQRRDVGKALGDELKQYGNLRVSVKQPVDNFLAEMKDSGLSYNPRTREFTSFQGTKFAPDEIEMLEQFFTRMKLLGESPAVKDIDNFIARTRTDLAFTKGRTGVLGTTNAERLINGGMAELREALNPQVNGIQQLNRYWEVNQTYAKLSDFVEEGSKYLGKLTQSGDFAKDASVAKSAVQSILNNGKKDFLVEIEALTGYNALDDAVLALQAMKDAGDFRGLSLLQAMKDDGIPTSKAGFTGLLIDKAMDMGKQVVAGSPDQQTRAFLKSLQAKAKQASKELSEPDKKVKAPKDTPRTKQIAEVESKIAKNVEAQKAAVKAKDFKLVAQLKKIYKALVAELKDLVQFAKDNHRSESGKINFFAARKAKPEAPSDKAFRIRTEDYWRERGWQVSKDGERLIKIKKK